LINAYVGKWQVEAITVDGTTTLVPSTVNAWATFSAEGGVRLHDTVNTIGGLCSAVKGGFAIRDASTTLAYYSGPDPTWLLVKDAFHAVVAAGRVAASVRDNRLTVTVGEFRVVFMRAT
jgi:hypothetical protein